MIVEKQNLGFGKRSWRYAAIIKDGTFDEVFVEPGMEDNHGQDPYEVSSPQNILKYLKGESYES